MMTVKKLRNAQARGARISVVHNEETVQHRKGSAAAKATTIFSQNLKPYLAGKVDRGDILAKVSKQCKIGLAAASTYFRNFIAREVVVGK